MFKKCILGMSMLAIMAFGFSSCSDDDADDTNCESCDLQGQAVEICDNGDDTFTFTAAGQSETISAEELEGVSPAEYIQLVCSLGDLIP
ncbi:MAG: hypothetical protein WBN55_10395 [Eudoraea sp.]|uniref:hypothetical protein n=1 Tax=Eudoraea sp. TaxID=1979955 RepID=UPI003C7808DD